MKATMLLASLLGVVSEAPPESILPMHGLPGVDEHASENVHGQRYSAGHRRLDVLDADNTDPIRIALDFSALYEATAPAYSACFNVGDWFRRGLPAGGNTPPANGIPTCVRDANEWSTASAGCWGKCEAKDIIDTDGRDRVIAVATTIANDFKNFFSVKPVSGNLKFDVDQGKYRQAIEDKGYTVPSSCASDCNWLNGVAADQATYCTNGVAADAVLSITKPPTIQGVAGSGGSCVVDQDHRPIWLVFAWISSLDQLTSDADANLVKYRRLVTHEIMHALGFSNYAFSTARDSGGNLKQLISLEQTVDTDGATDEVYFFKKGRAYELAQEYFNCYDEAQWQGLPLMGLPEVGRASHWETRVMRDDVMSYGDAPIVSAITLAAMEDLGWYLANYSMGQCMLWGFKQGCNYVKTRCGTGIDDSSASTVSASLCEGSSVWASFPDSYLTDKCSKGNDPCSSNAKNGYNAISGTCNSQCYTPEDGRNCSTSPEAPPGAATASDEKTFLGQSWTQWLWLLTWLFAGLAVVACIKSNLISPVGSKPVIVGLTVIIFLVGGGCVGFSLWAQYGSDAFDAFVGGTGLWIIFGVGVGLLVVSVATFVGVGAKKKGLLTFVVIVLVLLLVAELAFTILVFYWSWTLNEVSEDSANKLDGDASDKYDGKLGKSALEQVESFVCNTYTLCCRDPKLDMEATTYVPSTNSSASYGSPNATNATSPYNAVARETGTCLTLHEGLTTDVALTFEDPSQPEFCPYVTGSSNTLRPSPGTCDLLNNFVSGFSLDDCRDEFCPLGTEGYSDFLDNLLRWMRDNAIWLGAGFSLFVLVQLVLLANIWNMRGSVAFNRKGPTGDVDQNDQITAAWQAKNTPRGRGRSWMSPRSRAPRSPAGPGALEEMSETQNYGTGNYPEKAGADGAACIKL